MRKVIVGAMVSLDGVMQAPGGPDEDPTGGFKFGGWVWPHFDEEGGEAIGELFAKPFDLLLGRKTYDIFAAYWPYTDDDMGRSFTAATKYVATRDPELSLPWANSVSLAPDAVAAIRRLKAGDGPDLVTQGSTDFLHALFAADLVDELTTLTFPVILGGGKRLFGGEGAPGAWTLLSSLTTSTDVTVNRYARAGEVKTGSFAAIEPTEAELERRRKLE